METRLSPKWYMNEPPWLSVSDSGQPCECTTRPFLKRRRLDLPQLLDADAELLRIDAVAQVELGDELLGERAAHALGDQRVLGMQLHARRVAVLVLAVLADAHVAGGDALHRAVLVIEHLGGGEARIDLDAQRLGLLAEPATDVAQADDVVAVIVHQRRQCSGR